MESRVQRGAAEDGLVEQFQAGRLNVYVYESRPKMGAAAAAAVSAEIRRLQGERGRADECRRYAPLLDEAPPDFAVLGIGENGHLAFIDPPFCDFDDPEPVKVAELDEVCRVQQVHDGAFAALEEVPSNALSLTIPTVMARPKLFAIVPGPAKAQAIKGVIEGPIETACPATILRNHPDAHLFIDRDSASLLSR